MSSKNCCCSNCCCKIFALLILSLLYIGAIIGAIPITKCLLSDAPCCQKTNLILWILGLLVLVLTIVYFVFVYFINRMISICEEEMIRNDLLEKYKINK